MFGFGFAPSRPHVLETSAAAGAPPIPAADFTDGPGNSQGIPLIFGDEN